MDTLPLPSNEPSSEKTNFAGFDAVRGLAALGVVLLHACVPYLKNPMPGLAWPVQDSSSHAVDILGWTIELFIMPVFLVLAGFLAWQTLKRGGPLRLVKSRARRLLIPLAFGCLILLPITIHVWVLGWVVDGAVPLIKLRSLKFDGAMDRDLWGTGHLWFLQYLFLYVVVLAVGVASYRRWPKLPRVRFGTSSAWALLLAIAVVTLTIHPEVVWGFQHAFYPVPSKWVYCGLFFAVGLLLASRDGQLIWLRSRAAGFATAAVPLTTAAVYLGRSHVAGRVADTQLADVSLAGITVLAASVLTLAIIGLSVRYIRRTPAPLQYLAAASFWIYLVHHCVVGLLHIDLKVLWPDGSPVLKTLIAFSVSVGVSLLTYESLVRRTGFGRLLGFHWTPETETAASAACRPEPQEATSTRRAA